MYRSYFGLRALPFGASPDPEFLYVMPQVRETLAILQYGIASRKGFVVMTGEVGTGKTTLLRSVLSRFKKDRVSTAFVFNPCLEVIDFLEFVLTDFGLAPEKRTKSGMLIQLNRWLVERFRAHGVCVIAVDEAQNLSLELLEEIRLLTNLETAAGKLLQIVLSGQPELEETLCSPSVRQLRQRVSLWCRTRPLTGEETEAYITARLRVAGAHQAVFSHGAIKLVYTYSKGIPRLINLLCDHALISAYAQQIKPIPATLVQEVGSDLDLERQPFVLSSLALSGRSERPLQNSMLRPVGAMEGVSDDGNGPEL